MIFVPFLIVISSVFFNGISLDNSLVKQNNDVKDLNKKLIFKLEQDTCKSWTNTFRINQIGYLSIGDNIDKSLKKLSKDFKIKYDSIPECLGCEEFEYYYSVFDFKNNLGGS